MQHALRIIPITIEQAACLMTFKRIETPCPAIGYRLSAIGYRLSAIGYRLSAIESINRESAWESNPPTRLVTALFGFEDQGSHPATSALSGDCSSFIAPLSMLCNNYP
ncbi:hypothetical protein CJ255_00650 [Candidatus Viridilinea mediisalina]|uniref:Uncharacterized protein n=1 Tax=Candidatus Viridilinea mediisalina TaxID=2024553 RepID=A0A2A6RPY0_9CHLR|nr:hypothetical protein CJ255_00650 [Candidatus Viridilinea mediisalina]